MGLLTKLQSIFSGSGSETETITEEALVEEIKMLVNDSFDVVGYEDEIDVNDSDDERSEFWFLWRDSRDIEYELTVATDMAYEGYAIEFLVDGEEALTLREVPSGEVVDTLQEPFIRY